MKLQIIVILLATFGIATGLAVIGDEQILITVTSEGKAKISQSLFPESFVSTIDVKVISENISNLLAIDEENILLGTSQNQELLKIATLGASSVDLKYNADILSYESGVFKLKYNSDLESRVNLPPLSKLVSLNTIPVEITDEEYILPPGDISLSFSIRPVTSKEFFVPVDDSEYKIEAITAAKIEGFSANSDEIQFIIKNKAIVLTIIPTQIMANPNDALLNGEKVDFTQFHKNSTHSWIRIDPHEKGLVKILDTSKKTEEGGGCLIATATYGTEMAPQVQFLREIRDNQLMNTDSGVSFMTEFNSLYYSFSPYVADLERENPFFKEIVKIGITPLLSSLFVMEYAETDEEILGLGISVILMNIGMYFIFPFVICYQGMRIIRTRGMHQSSLVVISNCSVRSVLKIGLLGLIALFVLTVSIPSAFAQTDSESPIKMVLDITYQNIVESITDSGMDPVVINIMLADAEQEYNESIALIEGGDIVAAKQDAVLTMSYFENIAEDIAESNPIPSQLTPGFGAGIDSASDTGITQGQGLGVGGVPPGIINQLSASNVFEIQEEITEIDEEVGELRVLIESNGLDVNLAEYDESVNLAKEILANGDIPNAQAKLALANEIKDNLYEQIDTAVEESQDERVQEFADERISDIENILEKGENLGLTKKTIDELQDTLEVLKSGEYDEIIEKTGEDSEFVKEVKENNDISKEIEENKPGNSENAPGQNDEGGPGNSENAPGQNDEGGPGNSENAPGQNKDNNEFGDLPPGFGAAGDNPSESGFENGNGVGLGKLPPGLAKKMFDSVDNGISESFEDNPSESGFEDNVGGGFEDLPPGLAKKFDSSFSFEESFGSNPDDFYENSFEKDVDDSFENNFDGTKKGKGNGKGQFGESPGKSGDAPGQNKEKNDEGSSKTTICHKGNTISVSDSAVNSHIVNHGDTVGACGSDGSTPAAVGFPVIDISGNNPLCVVKKAGYSNPSATATDFESGDLSGSITIGGDTVSTKNPNKSFFVSYTVTDGTNTSVQTLTVNIANSCSGANTTPSIASVISDVSVNVDAVDTIKNLGTAFDDVEDADSDMTYSIDTNSNTDLVTTSISDTSLTLAYTASTTGTANIVVRAIDSEGSSRVDMFVVTVNAAGAPFVENAIADVSVGRNAPVGSINLGAAFDDAKDADNEMTYTLSNSNPALVTIPNNPALGVTTTSITYAEDISGTADITITATDSDNLTAQDSFTITVNDAPTITNGGIPDGSRVKNNDFVIPDISSYFDDAEDSDTEMSYTGTWVKTSGNLAIISITVPADSTKLTIVPQSGKSGTADITITATDTGGKSKQHTFELTFTNN